jgi:hypothetical protein
MAANPEAIAPRLAGPDGIDHPVRVSPFGGALTASLDAVLGNTFFTRLAAEPVAARGYRAFVREKYSTVAYFVGLLENAERLAAAALPEVAAAVRINRLDEIGYFSGRIRDEYRHEIWRLRSLGLLGVAPGDLTGLTLGSSRRHEEIMAGLARSDDLYEVVGALLFLELFVACEMKTLIAAFERDLPALFPADGYSYDRFPHNPHEYWYGHAIHDTWHFRSLEEPLADRLHGAAGDAPPLRALLAGIRKVEAAKQSFYSEALFALMTAS